jgi:hypothetical protein
MLHSLQRNYLFHTIIYGIPETNFFYYLVRFSICDYQRCAASWSCSDDLCRLLLSDRLWLCSTSRSTSPVGRTRLPWRHIAVGIWTPVSEDLWLPRALLWTASLGPPPMSLQGVNYLSIATIQHAMIVQTINKFHITFLSVDLVDSSSHITYFYKIEYNITDVFPSMSLFLT